MLAMAVILQVWLLYYYFHTFRACSVPPPRDSVRTNAQERRPCWEPIRWRLCPLYGNVLHVAICSNAGIYVFMRLVPEQTPRYHRPPVGNGILGIGILFGCKRKNVYDNTQINALLGISLWWHSSIYSQRKYASIHDMFWIQVILS